MEHRMEKERYFIQEAHTILATWPEVMPLVREDISVPRDGTTKANYKTNKQKEKVYSITKP